MIIGKAKKTRVPLLPWTAHSFLVWSQMTIVCPWNRHLWNLCTAVSKSKYSNKVVRWAHHHLNYAELLWVVGDRRSLAFIEVERRVSYIKKMGLSHNIPGQELNCGLERDRSEEQEKQKPWDSLSLKYYIHMYVHIDKSIYIYLSIYHLSIYPL